MIEFPEQTPQHWVTVLFEGALPQAWPVQYSRTAAIGQAVEAIHSILELDYDIQIRQVPEYTLVIGTPLTEGYPKRQAVNAYVLPAKDWREPNA